MALPQNTGNDAAGTNTTNAASAHANTVAHPNQGTSGGAGGGLPTKQREAHHHCEQARSWKNLEQNACTQLRLQCGGSQWAHTLWLCCTAHTSCSKCIRVMHNKNRR